MTRLALIIAAALVLAAPIAASNPNNLGWNRTFTWLQQCNDWQSTPGNCVTDTPNGGPPCVWGDEDELTDVAIGKLSAGQSTSVSECVVTDMCNDGACPHLILFKVQPATGIRATLTSDRGENWAATTSGSGGRSVAEICISDPIWTGINDPSLYPPITGTNGGVGYLTRYTLTITATKTTQIGAAFDIASSHSEGEYGYFRQLSDVPCPETA